jgi:hypothetical protein
MKENLTVVLEQLKTARIQVGRRTLRKQVNLFEFDNSHEIEFNGHHSTIVLSFISPQFMSSRRMRQ